jgi:hypothetical protein
MRPRSMTRLMKATEVCALIGSDDIKPEFYLIFSEAFSLAMLCDLISIGLGLCKQLVTGSTDLGVCCMGSGRNSTETSFSRPTVDTHTHTHTHTRERAAFGQLDNCELAACVSLLKFYALASLYPNVPGESP